MDVGIDLHPGQWLGLCGANGAGKTTLIRALTGRIPVSAGSIHLHGRSEAASRVELAADCGVSLEGAALPGSLRVGDVFRILRSRQGMVEPATIEELFATLDLQRVWDKPVKALSSGWRQRLAICAAFVPLRPIIILDEPFNWLDPVTAFQLKAVVRRFAEEGFAVLTCEHDLSTVVYKCDRAVFLSEGRVRGVFDQAELQAAQGDFGRFEADLIALMAKRPGSFAKDGGQAL